MVDRLPITEAKREALEGTSGAPNDTNRYVTDADPRFGSVLAHATSHQNGGSDEIDVTGLSGLLADPQTPATHNHDASYDPLGAATAAVAAHEAAADPHVGYQKESEKDAAGGYPGLDGSAQLALARLPLANADGKLLIRRSGSMTYDVLADGDIPAAIARDSEVTTAVSNHEAAADPHTGYQKESEKGAASGYASLDGSTLVPAAQLGTGSPNSSNFLRGDRTWAAPAGGPGASWTSIEQNLGSVPRTRGSFVLTDAAISGSSVVLIQQAPGPYTGKGTRADEAEMDRLFVYAEPGTGQATVKWSTLEGITLRHNTDGEFGGRGIATLLAGEMPPYDYVPTRLGKVKGNFKFVYQVT